MKKLKFILSLAGVLALGVYFGIGVTTHNVVTPESKQKALEFASRREDGSFILANFERPGDFKIWKFVSASMLPSAERVQEGGLSARVTFHAGDRMSAMIMEDFARRKDLVADWSGFKSLRFDVYNPDYEKRKLTLLVTDTSGSRYAHELELPERVWQEFDIPVSEMAAVLNIQKIDAVSLSMHPVKMSQQFYLDDVLLVPDGHPGVRGKDAGAARAAGPVRVFDYGFSKRKAAWEVRDPNTKQSFVRVPFIVKNEVPAACNACPVDGGVPFPMGELSVPVRLRLLDAAGKALPFQTRILAAWPDQSVRWLGLHFETSLAPAEIKGYVLEYGPGIAAPDFPGDLEVSETADEIRVNTQRMEAVLNKRSFFLFDRVSFDRNRNGVMDAEETAVSKAKLTLGFRGKEFRTDLDKQSYRVGVEEKGPQRVVIKAGGWYQSQDGRRYCRAIVRYTFYQGKSFVKVVHTLVYTGYPENRADTSFRLLKLPDNETIETYGMVLPYSFSKNQGQSVRIGKITPEVLELAGESFCRLLQLDWEKANVETGAGAMFPEQAYAGWLDVSDNAQGITVAVRDFRENFPKGLAADSGKGEIRIDLWPREAGDLDLATTEDARGPDTKGSGHAFGVAKTHEILLDFHPG
ncbi:MAG: hypothetical protein PHS88_11525, partial [Candidatus Omnitrophica bacterium]|nr:hypothetical protein [Candidatus Omnitrophota bacterium]